MRDTERTAPGPVPIFLSKSAQAHKAAVRYYNDQVTRLAAAKKLNPANLPYAAENTAPDDLMALAKRHGIDLGGNAPAEQGLHSWLGRGGPVQPSLRPRPRAPRLPRWTPLACRLSRRELSPR